MSLSLAAGALPVLVFAQPVLACAQPACLAAQVVHDGLAAAGNAGHAVTTWLPLVDWLALVFVLLGVVAGAMSGLPRAFGMLLWMLAALWLAHHLSAQVVSWMPNTAPAGDPSATLTAYGVITALVLALPVLGRVFGGSGGKKKAAGQPQHKPFGALVGLLVACLFVTLLLPFARRVSFLERGWQQARAPALGSAVAEHATYLFPEAHREAIRPTRLGP
ncbi:MAG TPA: CvpA family protein [Planctomycetota bacterium]|nr:CvpA family protein [Planctomycetota bacterium]